MKQKLSCLTLSIALLASSNGVMPQTDMYRQVVMVTGYLGYRKKFHQIGRRKLPHRRYGICVFGTLQ